MIKNALTDLIYFMKDKGKWRLNVKAAVNRTVHATPSTRQDSLSATLPLRTLLLPVIPFPILHPAVPSKAVVTRQ